MSMDLWHVEEIYKLYLVILLEMNPLSSASLFHLIVLDILNSMSYSSLI